MYSTTGLRAREIDHICALIQETVSATQKTTWPAILGLRKSVVIALTYLRRNRAEAELAETYGVSQPTISRAITTITPILATVLADAIPVAEDLSDDAVYIVDGTLLPCWSWRDHPELYSGKHKTTGYNVQVAATLSGTLAWVSDPIPGARHDTHVLTESDVLEDLTKENWIGDKGYIGTGIHTPTRKPPSRALTQTEKECNTTINKIRWIIEQVIANLKTWRILHTDYRRPLKTFATTITATLGLQFYRLAA